MGLHENFPANVHRIDGFSTKRSAIQVQQKLLKTMQEINCEEFSFEEVANPTIPQGKIIFEFGIAQSQKFTYLDKKELKETLNCLSKKRLVILDFFCGVRYYKINGEKKTPLKFDYYLLRTVFSKDIIEFLIFHERGPRYISPEELSTFLLRKINEGQKKKGFLQFINESI